MFFKILLFLFIFVFLEANDFEILFSIYTTHLTDNERYEKNQLKSIRYKNYIGGYFINSFKQDTFFMGNIKEKKYKNIKYGFSYGGIYGYCLEPFVRKPSWNIKDCNQRILPYISPYIGIENEYYSAQLISFYTAKMIVFGIKF